MKKLSENMVIFFAIIGLIVVCSTVDSLLEKWIGLSSVTLFLLFAFILSITYGIYDRITRKDK